MSIREAFPNIRRETTIREAFYHLSPLFDFLSCGLLKYIVNEHGSNSLIIMMKKYDDDVLEFMKKTTVKELMDNLSGQSDEVPPNFSKMRAKINRDPAAYTLYHLDQLRKRYCCELKLTDVVLVLIGLEMANSFIVEWIIPSALVPQLISSARKLDVGFYLNERMTQITVDEEQIFLWLPKREEAEITAGKLDETDGTLISGLRGYYKARNAQIPVGGRDPKQAAAMNDDQCPDTSNWPTADRRNSEYIVAVHVAMEVSRANTITYTRGLAIIKSIL